MVSRENSVTFAGEFALQSTVFCMVCLVFCWIGFVFHVAITPLYIPFSAVFLLVFIGVRPHDNLILKRRALVLLCMALVVGLTVLVSNAMVDTSWDGNSYHQVAVIALSNGWNPVYAPHVVPWWSTMFPDKSWLGQTIINDGLWTDHYPKAAWILGAAMVSVTKSLNTATWLQTFLAVSAVCAMYRGFALAGVSRGEAAVLATVAALSPVAIAQTGTNYVDGLLASVLLIQIGAAMSWLSRSHPEDLLILIIGAIISANLKFTGLVYSAILALVVIVTALKWRKQYSRSEIAILGVGIAAFLVVSSQTYVLNIEHGHPFYPINKTDVMGPTMDNVFLAFGKWTKFFISLFSVPSVSDNTTPAAELFLPSFSDYATIIRAPDTRVNGFGSLFGWSLMLSLGGALICWCSVASRRRLGRNGFVVTILLFGTAIGACVNPELWLARYVPQLWFVPILAASLAFMADRKRLATIMLAPALIGSVLCLEFWTRYTVAEQSRIDNELSLIAAMGHVELLDGWHRNEGVFTFVNREQIQGVDVRFADARSPCPAIMRIGLVGVCQSDPRTGG
jgi:hypothetical protein